MVTLHTLYCSDSKWLPSAVDRIKHNMLFMMSILASYYVHSIPIYRSGKPSARVELLHNIDPLITPPSTWPNESIAAGHKSFSTRTYAALRYKDWKIVTGYQSKFIYLFIYFVKQSVQGCCALQSCNVK